MIQSDFQKLTIIKQYKVYKTIQNNVLNDMNTTSPSPDSKGGGPGKVGSCVDIDGEKQLWAGDEL